MSRYLLPFAGKQVSGGGHNSSAVVLAAARGEAVRAVKQGQRKARTLREIAEVSGISLSEIRAAALRLLE